MDFFKRLFAPKEVKLVIVALNQFSRQFHSEAYREIRDQIEENVMTDYQKVKSQVKNEKSAREAVYFSIAELTAEFIESGRYITEKGIVNPLASNDLLKIFDTAVDRLLQEGAISQEERDNEKFAMREAIELFAKKESDPENMIK